MRHLKKGRKLGRKRDQRRALMKSLAESLIIREKITTTETRAKELSSFIEKKVTLAKKKSTLLALRELTRIFSKETAQKLVKEIAPRFKARDGGYTRIIKLVSRKGDGARMVIIEFV